MEQIENLVNEAERIAKQVIEVDGLEHKPLLLLDTPDGVEVVGLGRFQGHLRQAFPHVVPWLLRKRKATAYIFIYEGWLAEEEAVQKAKERGIEIQDLPPDDRVEALQMVVCEKGKEPWLVTAKIYNTPQGRKLGDYAELKPPILSLEGYLAIKHW